MKRFCFILGLFASTAFCQVTNPPTSVSPGVFGFTVQGGTTNFTLKPGVVLTLGGVGRTTWPTGGGSTWLGLSNIVVGVGMTGGGTSATVNVGIDGSYWDTVSNRTAAINALHLGTASTNNYSDFLPAGALTGYSPSNVLAAAWNANILALSNTVWSAGFLTTAPNPYLWTNVVNAGGNSLSNVTSIIGVSSLNLIGTPINLNGQAIGTLFAAPTITNGLATIVYANSLTNGYDLFAAATNRESALSNTVFAAGFLTSIDGLTNGLAAQTYVASAVLALSNTITMLGYLLPPATNGFVYGGITNGLLLINGTNSLAATNGTYLGLKAGDSDKLNGLSAANWVQQSQLENARTNAIATNVTASASSGGATNITIPTGKWTITTDSAATRPDVNYRFVWLNSSKVFIFDYTPPSNITNINKFSLDSVAPSGIATASVNIMIADSDGTTNTPSSFRHTNGLTAISGIATTWSNNVSPCALTNRVTICISNTAVNASTNWFDSLNIQ